MTKINHALKVLTITASVFFMGYFLESLRHISSIVGDYFAISTELLPLVLSFSIFGVTWYSYRRSRDNHSLFLGAVFFVIGLFYLFHLLSYPFMPDFITPNSPQKATIFWSEAWLISALLFLASAYIYKETLPGMINKSVLFASAIALSFISLATTLFYLDHRPDYPDGNPSTANIFLLLITAVIILYASYLYTRRLRETGHKNLICLIYGFIIIIFSYPVYFFYEYPEHLLRAAGFYFVYLALYKSSIDQPYETLALADEKLRQETEEKYCNLFDNAHDAIITTDLDDRITSWNRSAEKMFGWTANEVIGKKLSELIIPQSFHEERKQIIHDAVSGMEVMGFDTVNLRKDGTEINVNVTISPLRDADRNTIALSSIVRDITERKRAEKQIKESLKEKEVLLREIHHRVKNNMQIISSLLRLQSGYITEKKYTDMFKESQNRIISMSLIHEKLYQSKGLARIDFNEYIRDLVNGLFHSYGVSGSIALNIDGKDVSLGVDSAIPCGLIINELVTNSLKHAFPEGREGEIRISLRSIEENMIELLVSDNGVSIPEDVDIRKTESLGLHLVTILVENQLHGEINLNRSKGTEFQIKFRDVK